MYTYRLEEHAAYSFGVVASGYFRNTPKFLPTHMTPQSTVLTYLLIYFMELSPS